jgi:carbamoyl-phosphate synthase large subunit
LSTGPIHNKAEFLESTRLLDNDYLIRRKAIDFDVSLITNLQLAKRFVEAIYRTALEDLKVKSWDEYN